MIPEIKRSHVFAKDIFKANKVESKFKYLNLELITDDKFNNPDPFGIYFMFFKKNLIYIGSWCGNWDKNNRKLEDSAANERWYKHIITDTTRFQDITFRREDDKFDVNEIINLLKNQKEKIKRNKKGKVTLDKTIDLYKSNKVDVIKYEHLINSRFLDINNKINSEYCSQMLDSTICEDVIYPLNNIKFNDQEKYQKILAGGDMAHSLNRFKVASSFWNDFKNRNENNIFDDFEFVYFRFNNFINYIPLEYLDNNLLKDSDAKEEVKKSFRKEFEKPLRETFKPPANQESTEFILKKYDIISFSKDVEQRLINLYNNQSFFRE